MREWNFSYAHSIDYHANLMDTLTKINKKERELHAAKGRLRNLKHSRWVAENYHDKPVDKRAIKQTEQEITEYRKTLAELYKKI